jgi:hypothetical protein
LTGRTWIHPTGGTPRPRPAWLLVLIPGLALGCSTLGDRGEALVPTRHRVRTGPFLIYSNTPIPADSPSIRCLQSLESDLASRLNYRPRDDEDPVEIYVLNDRDAFTHFLKFYYPELPPRRAFFLAQGSRRVVYTYQSARLDEDLRHEATHALLRGSFGDLPLWLDEGLAEYFETRTDAIDAQHEHLARIPEDLKQGWVPDLPRLESLTDIHQMTPRDYREAWAWVHLMLNRGGRPEDSPLVAFLNQARAGSRSQALSQMLAARGMAGQSLVAHLEAIQSRMAARKPELAPQERLIRLQDRGPEPPAAIVPPTAPHRGGLLRRIGSWLGL